MFDFIVISFLYSITRSKVSFVINLAEFIPFLGDFLPVYTVSTIIWILRESGYDGLITAKQLLRLLSNAHTRVWFDYEIDITDSNIRESFLSRSWSAIQVNMEILL